MNASEGTTCHVAMFGGVMVHVRNLVVAERKGLHGRHEGELVGQPRHQIHNRGVRRSNTCVCQNAIDQSLAAQHCRHLRSAVQLSLRGVMLGEAVE